ncbi:hypothetical protein QDY71_10675 [Kingella negevensis]|nr:hypothetical protein [Kingella negevensis]MDK4679418.1 hypothetical protein [Kingella negevensis]MDK4682864.1 hypothetical protein [Kingella negevensis]MDK4684885.1 hypothetical protein [Kingella negevensis]MDK4691061.1 hypothetical protein [Kingella negevensis]MDK4693792.1 hypothetical protein [Kingella negevensis]
MAKPSRHRRLDSAAKQAAMASQYAVASYRGKAVYYIGQQGFNFGLEN